MSARDIAATRLADQSRRFPILGFTREASDAAGSEPLSRAIEQAAIRQWLTLRNVLQHHLRQPWETIEPKLQAILLCGAAQLLLLDDQPTHSVIDHAVGWAKTNIRAGAGGLVNAVLRRVAESRTGVQPLATTDLSEGAIPRSDGTVVILREAVFAADPIQRLATQTSHPPELIAQWHTTFGAKQAHQLAMHGLVEPPVIVGGTVAEGVIPSTRRHREAGFLIFNGPKSALRPLLEANPHALVQDPTAAAAVGLTAALTPRIIIDYCAGRGTKTRQLARLHPDARIIATDVDTSRFKILSDVAEHLPNVEAVQPREIAKWNGQADILVLDVPCSNTGVLARRVEARYRYSGDAIQSLVSVQRQIIADALPLLAPGGSVLYSTCSIEAAENEHQIAWLTRWHPFTPADLCTRLPTGLPGEDPANYTDGGYSALLSREAD